MSVHTRILAAALCVALFSSCEERAVEERISCSSGDLSAAVLEQDDRLYFVLVNAGCKTINAPDGAGIDTLTGTFIVSPEPLDTDSLTPLVRPELENSYVEIKARGVSGTVVTKHEARELFGLPPGCQTVHIYYVVNSVAPGHSAPLIRGSSARICV